MANDDAKHILDHHGDPEKELAQGNIPLEGWMLDSLPDVVTAPSSVEKGHTGSGKNRGKPVYYSKRYFRAERSSVCNSITVDAKQWK
ncbi:MAG: hypothetical protein IKC24_07705 [Oscillospiraceae bacterium]|nr:hypothetical protein [Oscillospiraceae bacterium]